MKNVVDKKMVSTTKRLSWGITDCQSLKSVRERVDELVEEYGEDAKIYFDSGYNNISEEITFCREETDEECATRLSAEAGKAELQRSKDLAQYKKLKAKLGLED